METELERMIIRLIGDGSSYKNMMTQAQVDTKQASGQIGESANEAGSMWSNVWAFITRAIGPMAALTGIAGVMGTAFKGVQLAADWEKNEIAFSTMLGSVEKGKQLVQDLQDFAAATPLNTGDLQQAAKTLLQYGTAGDQIMPTLRMLGDVTGGDAEKFNGLARAFGQMQSTGRLMGQDLMQMINVGFNPLQEISRTTGRSMGELKQDMEKGGISVQMVKEAFRSATSAGGQFDGLMEKQSKSIGGLFSTMQDDISSSIRELGFAIIEGFMLKDLMQGVSTLAQMTTKFIKWTVGGVKEIGGYLGITKDHLRALGFAVGIVTIIVGLFALAWYGTIPAILLAGKVFNFMFGGLGIIIGLVIVAAVAIAAWVMSIGGVGKAWEKMKEAAIVTWNWIKQAAMMFWAWIKPTVDAGIAMMVESWEWVKVKAGEAWDWIKIKTLVFWEWIRPTVVAGIFFLVALWDVLVVAAQWAWDWVKYYAQEAWSWLTTVWGAIGEVIGEWFDTASVGDFFETIKYAAVFAFTVIEYGIRNFGSLWELTVSYVAFKASEAWDNIKTGWGILIGSALGTGRAIGAAFGWVWDNLRVGAATAMQAILRSLASMASGLNTVMQGVSNVIIRLIDSLGAVAQLDRTGRLTGMVTRARQSMAGVGNIGNDLAGNLNRMADRMNPGQFAGLGDLGNRVGENFRGGLANGMAFIGGGESDLTRELRREFEAQGGEFIGGFEAFLAQRMAEINAFQFGFGGLGGEVDATARSTNNLNNQLGNTASKMKEIKNIDATSLFSADALAKVEKQMEMINKSPTAGSNRDAAIEDGAEGMQRLQREGNGFLAQMARREPVVLQPAGL